MSPAIDEAPESKPATRAMKLAGAPKKTKPNSIPLKTVNERKSQEWSDWKEDEEDWWKMKFACILSISFVYYETQYFLESKYVNFIMRIVYAKWEKLKGGLDQHRNIV